jgi:hypothetical protein
MYPKKHATFISIQSGAYWLNVKHIVSIEVSENALEVTTNDGHGPYTVDDAQEVKKLKEVIEVIEPDLILSHEEWLRHNFHHRIKIGHEDEAVEALWEAAENAGLLHPSEKEKGCPDTLRLMDANRASELIARLGW